MSNPFAAGIRPTPAAAAARPIFGAAVLAAPTSLLTNITAGATTLWASTTALQGAGLYVIIALITGLAIAVILLVIDNFVPFLPINPISGPSAAARAGKTFWKDGDSENLIVPAASSPTTNAAQYTMSVEIVIGDTRAPSLGKFRHVVHRGSNPCGISAPASGAGASGQAGIQPSDLPPDTEPTYLSLGLPQVMNPGLFLDTYKNDMHIFVHTQGNEEGMSVLLLESMTVADLPLNTPFTLGLVCNGTTLEVYLNCALYSTMVLKGTPYLPKMDNQWFGRYCAYPMSGLVKKLQLWSTALSVGDYKQLCGSASFNMDNMPSSCATSTSASATSTAATTSSAVAQAKSYFNLS
jgi:hypothetical protein